MRKSTAIALLLAPLLFGWLAESPRAGGNPPEAEYDADSWKTMIAESCKAFFDGCNQCRRGEDASTGLCTLKACAIYQKPRCLDQPITEGSMGGPPFSGRLVRFSCGDGASLRVYYEQYVSGDQLVALAEDEIMLVDEQTHTAHRLLRQRAASGAKYAGGALEFWEHGGEAMLRQDGQRLYGTCKVSG